MTAHSGGGFQFGKFSDKAFKSILTSNKRINIWEGSVRSGKTIASIVRWLEFVRTAPPGLLLIVGKTERTIRRNLLDTMIQMTNDKIVDVRGDAVFIYGRQCYLASAYDERSEQRIRGMTISGSYGDELTLWPESFFSMLLSRMSVRGAKFFGTTNPDSPYHWLKVNYLDRIGSGIKNINRYSFTIDDNPNLDPEYVASLKQEYTGLFYKRFILGQWVLAEGAVYDMWDESIHVVDTNMVLKRLNKTAFDNYIVSVDYGTNNPCTFGLYGWNRGGGPVYLVKEYYYNSRESGRQKTDREYVDDFKLFTKGIRPQAIYVDPSASSFIAELRHNSFSVTHANNDVLEGIRFVSNLLKSGGFYVDRRCHETIKEFGSYVWDERAQEIGIDRPIKEFDHTMDRNRYALASHFFKERPVIYKGFKY